MKFIADFHIHSHFSIATSRKLVPEYLEYWARLKGINVIGTGDCVHPGWQQELAEKLEPCGNGLYKLKKEYRLEESKRLKHEFIPDEVYFMLTGEVSSIYRRDGKVRKVHNICVFPDMESLKKVQVRLEDVGNIRSDGRPILGLDSRVLLDMVLESSPESFVIPAHIWTPWFSVLGSKSGFDSMEECYGDLTPEIFAVETGLSSDPEMNWRCSFLDRFRLVSNSDAHSPEKLGREANLFDTELSYSGIYNALKFDRGFTGTIEFYPEEGKYHYDGHRNCGVVWNPLDTVKNRGICPVCGKGVTKGVMYRVAELGDRSDAPDSLKKEFHSITQLPDLLSEVMRQKSSSSKSVMAEYMRLIRALGSEFHIYLDSGRLDLSSAGGELFAEGVRRIRDGEVRLQGGYDGEFGTVRVFEEGEIDTFRSSSLFGDSVGNDLHMIFKKHSVEFDVCEFKRIAVQNKQESSADIIEEYDAGSDGLSAEQESVVSFDGGPCMVIAGPGAGKTFLIVEKVKRLMEGGIEPTKIAVLTFSNKAAEELKERLGDASACRVLQVSTFHSLGLKIIKANPESFGLREGFIILNDEERLLLAENLSTGKNSPGSILRKISACKQGIETDIDPRIVEEYVDLLSSRNFIDVDDLVYLPCRRAEVDDELREKIGRMYSYVLIDEIQDINSMQYRFIRLLAPAPDANIFIIGDPDQSIYGFRGASPLFVDRLKIDYSGLREFVLKKSFRCSSVILRAAGQILGRGEYLLSNSKGVKIIMSELASDRSEADWIASEIDRMVGGVRSFSIESGIADGESDGRGFGDFAVLCRSAFMFDCIIEAFMNHGIAYKVAGSRPFYEYEPYKAVIQRIRNVLTGIGADSDNRTGEIKSLMNELSVAGVITRLLEEGGVLFDSERINSVFGGISGYDEFLRAVPLRTGEDDFIPEFEAVSLMTIHSSKGLQFDTVFIPGCEEGVLPFNLFGSGLSDIKEEERIFYVAMTRAKRRVYLTNALKRNYKGRVLDLPRSSFLDRIEKDIIDAKKRAQIKKKEDGGQLNLF